jgi:hypothetical protein
MPVELALERMRMFKRRVDDVINSPMPAAPADQAAWQKRHEAAVRLQKATEDALDIAQNDPAKAVAWAGKVKAEFESQHAARVLAGLNPGHADHYVKRILEADPDDSSAYAMPAGGGAAGFDRSQNKHRTFKTVYDAMEQGKKLASMDVSGLVAAGQIDTAKALANEHLFDQFRGTNVPGETRKVIADPRKVWNPEANGGKGGLETKSPGPQYVAIDGPRGEKLYVDGEFAPYFRNLLKGSAIRDNRLLSGILHTAADLKHGILLFDTFHVGRVMARLANLLGQSKYGGGLKNLDIPAEILQKLGITSGNAKYGRGRALLDFRPSTLQTAKDLGWINDKDMAWAMRNQAKLALMEKSGYNVAGNLDNLYERSGHGLLNQGLKLLGHGDINVGNGIETFNKWVFQKLTRNAMAIGWTEAYDRNKARFPGKSDMQVAQITSREMNAYFGNLGRQGLFKSATAQDAARMVFLAPQWANSMIESQARGIGQLARAPHDLVNKRGFGSTAGAMAAGYLGMLAANQIINLLTKKQLTFDNEEGHKLDAYIPGGKHGFYLNPASIVAEELHTLQRYMEGGNSPEGAAGRILMNKSSPIGRAITTGVFGIDTMGKPVGPGKRLEGVGKQLAPLPIFTSGLLGSTINPEMAQKGDVQRQAFGMLGVKLDRGQGPGQKLRNMVNQTIPTPFPKNESQGDYAALRAYVNNDHESNAKAEILDLLRKGKTLTEINNVFRPKPLGGSAQRQALFLSKRPDAVAQLEPAARENSESQQKLAELIQSIPQDELREAIEEGAGALLK